MGWTSTSLDGQTPLEYIRRRCLTWEPDNPHRYTVLALSMVGTVAYGAVEKIHKETGEREVFGVIFLTSRKEMNGYDFGYKGMGDADGPCESRCPVKILDMLTPTDSEYANNWRARCRAYHASKREASKKTKGFDTGSVILFKEPLSFGSFKAQRFEVIDKIKGHYWATLEEGGRTKVKLTRAFVGRSLATEYARIDLAPTLAPGESGLSPTLTSRVMA